MNRGMERIDTDRERKEGVESGPDGKETEDQIRCGGGRKSSGGFPGPGRPGTSVV